MQTLYRDSVVCKILVTQEFLKRHMERTLWGVDVEVQPMYSFSAVDQIGWRIYLTARHESTVETAVEKAKGIIEFWQEALDIGQTWQTLQSEMDKFQAEQDGAAGDNVADDDGEPKEAEGGGYDE